MTWMQMTWMRMPWMRVMDADDVDVADGGGANEWKKEEKSTYWG